MIKKNVSPILVTGSHHSGSTWAGKMIALSEDVEYIHEPFNPKIGVCRWRFNNWFTYVCKENEEIFKPIINDCIQFKYRITRELKSTGSVKDVGRTVRDYFKFIRSRLYNKRALIKDPIALFSADWLSKSFNMKVLVLIRHPAAFVGSLKKRNSTFPFSHLLSQKLLIVDHLSEFAPQIKKYTHKPPDIIDQGILLWNIFHTIILKYQRNKENVWIYKRHEDLSRDPVNQFQQIYDDFDLEFSSSIKKKIEDFSFANKKQMGEFKRDSAATINSWKKRLTNKEIYKIRKQTYNVSRNFYTDSDW